MHTDVPRHSTEGLLQLVWASLETAVTKHGAGAISLGYLQFWETFDSSTRQCIWKVEHNTDKELMLESNEQLLINY